MAAAYTPVPLIEPKSLMPPMPPITKAFLLAIVGMFCLSLLVPSLQFWLALWPLQSGAFMPWQPVTYAFLHGDPMHLFFNALGLWMCGSELERVWGARRYWQLLLASVLAAALVQLLLTATMGSARPTVGASGALFGLLLSFGMLFPDRIIMPLFPPIPMKAKIFVAVFGSLELVLGLMGGGGIAHFAHLGGMLGAWLMMQYWRRGGRR
jgi:membrane associated rhomboid family serine protease